MSIECRPASHHGASLRAALVIGTALAPRFELSAALVEAGACVRAGLTNRVRLDSKWFRFTTNLHLTIKSCHYAVDKEPNLAAGLNLSL